MSRSRPKFAVGEEALFGTVRPYKVEIDRAEYHEMATDQRGEEYTGWAYHCAGDEPSVLAQERHLKKIPPEQRTQWKDCAWQPKKEGVTA